MTDSVNGITNYVYDTLNRVSSIENPASSIVSFDYDALSRRTLTTLPNGTTTEFDYDPASQLLTINHKLLTTAFSTFGYTYDNVGNRVTSDVTRATLSVNPALNYTYDNLYRLIDATNPIPSEPDETFNYDALGNRDPLTSTYDNANRLLNDGTNTYMYDNNGNLTQKTEPTLTTDYIYDAENQLIEIKENTVTIAQYRYDGLGRRIEKDVPGVGTTRYVYDNEDMHLEYNGSNILQASYTHGAGIDEPLIMNRGGVNSFYHADGLGSITDLTDNSGAVVQSYVYNSFGEIVLQNGSLINPYTYTGREFDAESGLYYYRARNYDPSIGRFIQEDPYGFVDSFNPYVYAINNSINWVDPFGEQVMYPGVPNIIPPTGIPITGIPGQTSPTLPLPDVLPDTSPVPPQVCPLKSKSSSDSEIGHRKRKGPKGGAAWNRHKGKRSGGWEKGDDRRDKRVKDKKKKKRKKKKTK